MKQTLSLETPARVRRGQFRAPALVGASALAMACSFGQIDGETPINPVQPPGQAAPGAAVDIPGTATPTTPVGTGTQTAAPTSTGSTTAAAPVAFDPNDPFNSSELGKEVRAILEVNCGRCHEGTKSGNMDYVLQLPDLVKNGKVVPGNKEDSQIFVRMQQQSMPPAFERVQRPTFGQIDQVGQFIDELPTNLYGSDNSCNKLPFFSSDDQIATMEADILKVNSTDQPFIRYMTITYSSNAGDCEGIGKAVQRQRYALYKGINSVSTEPNIGIPQPIDANQTIFRIDIRDYNWDRPIDLQDDGVVDFNDGWLAIVNGVGAYGVSYTGDQADVLRQTTQTDVPFLPVNAFIQFTEQADLYYSLIGGRANLGDFEKDVLKIDTKAEIANDNLLRAGFSNSGVSKQERGLDRFEQGTAGGYAYWVSFDFDGGGGGQADPNKLVLHLANDSIYSNPLDFKFTGGEAIFNLPNGMQGYYVANAAGKRLAEAPVGIVIDPAQNNGNVTNGASCHSCHNAGMISFTDTVRQYVIDNKVLFDNATFESVMNQYPDQKVFQATMDLDSELHVSRVVEAGVPRGTPDPVSRLFLDFQLGNVDVTQAAGELNVSKEFLLANVQKLNPELVNLGKDGGFVDRDIFTNNYVSALCTLHSVDNNTPANCP